MGIGPGPLFQFPFSKCLPGYFFVGITLGIESFGKP